MKCPRDNCNNEAIIDKHYGVLPCNGCRLKDNEIKVMRHSIEFNSVGKHTRIVQQRDKYAKDILQPWQGKNNDPNPDFVKAYPNLAKEYFTDKQLKKL